MPAPLVLALDTSTLVATAALLRGERVLGEIERRVTTHSERLLSAIDELLRGAGVKVAEVDAIACGRGPGSFTGLRIGMSTAKGLSWAMEKPLVTVSSLAALVRNVGLPRPPLVVPCLDARRGEVFAGFFGQEGEVEAEAVLLPEELRDRLSGRAALLVGDGALAYPNVFANLRVASDGHAVRAREIGALALARLARGETDDPARAEPTYLRASDAEVGRRRR
jgi:tRNA threonylcarbamoyladenosine biosynthesis protein TsaB